MGGNGECCMETEVSALGRLLDELRRIKATVERPSVENRSNLKLVLAKLTKEAGLDSVRLP
jgi:hypothetical protein